MKKISKSAQKIMQNVLSEVDGDYAKAQGSLCDGEYLTAAGYTDDDQPAIEEAYQALKITRASVRAEKTAGGYYMALILPGKGREYPEDKRIYTSTAKVYIDARQMFGSKCWDWRESDKSILIG